MSVSKIATLKGKIDCPYCMSLIQWDDKDDIETISGHKFITCPECGEHLILEDGKDYWFEETNE